MKSCRLKRGANSEHLSLFRMEVSEILFCYYDAGSGSSRKMLSLSDSR
jgi:hypothetical protein